MPAFQNLAPVFKAQLLQKTQGSQIFFIYKSLDLLKFQYFPGVSKNPPADLIAIPISLKRYCDHKSQFRKLISFPKAQPCSSYNLPAFLMGHRPQTITVKTVDLVDIGFHVCRFRFLLGKKILHIISNGRFLINLIKVIHILKGAFPDLQSLRL